MANLLWGKIFYSDSYAGILREEPGDRFIFEYDESYLNSNQPAIAYSLSKNKKIHISQVGLHSFFDNLVAEGWLEHAQTRLLGKRQVSRFELLLAFGFDCAGAVSILDPEPERLTNTLLNLSDPLEMAVLASRASLSGVQPKLAVKEINGTCYPATVGDLSTHIAKFPSSEHNDLIFNEYLTSLASKALLPEDSVVELTIGTVKGITEPALIIKRFDRTSTGRLHFEEFNQLLERKSIAKYDGTYSDMSKFILESKSCLPVENYKLYARILVGLLLGNTDMHFKNFAMFHTQAGLRLTPSYDQVAATLYKYKTVALGIAGSQQLLLTNLKAKNLVLLAGEFHLSTSIIDMLIQQIHKNINTAKGAIATAPFGEQVLKDQLIQLMETRWNGTFALIGKTLLKKQS